MSPMRLPDQFPDNAYYGPGAGNLLEFTIRGTPRTISRQRARKLRRRRVWVVRVNKGATGLARFWWFVRRPGESCELETYSF